MIFSAINLRNLSAALICILAVSSAAAQESVPPEGATPSTAKSLVIAQRHMIVAANPLAAEAGREILRAGGSAVDAAIATQLVLGLVEPQSSGLGGGAFLVHWDAGQHAVDTYDGRETAPAAAKTDRFLSGGSPMPFKDAVLSGLSVGVPGVVRMLADVHARHGKLPWAQLFQPAITLAENGFAVPARLSQLLAAERAEDFSPAARSYFFDDSGKPRSAGETLKNPQYAATLKVLAEKGASAFYDGAIAGEIVAAVAASPRPGDLAIADFTAYRAEQRDALCFNYRAHKICGMGPPSSGALTIGATLKLIEPITTVHGAAAAMTAPALHAISEAEKLAFADRNRYVADPAFVTVPSGLLDDAYLSERRKLIDPIRSIEKAQAGLPPGLSKRSQGIDATHEMAGTSHLSIVDDAGNAVAMTTTIESAFGSHLWAAGFLLNNQMTDFSFRAIDQLGDKIVNAVEPGKRPRSSMAPTLVFDAKGELEAVTGSPGGSKIILFLVKSLVAMFDWDMDPQAAAALPNFGSEGGALQLEGADTLDATAALKGLGHSIVTDPMSSGMHTILRRSDHLEGGADPRREGVALGD